MKDLWQRHDYSGDLSFPKDGIISWQFREKDKRLEWWVELNLLTDDYACRQKKEWRGPGGSSMSGRCITSLTGVMSGSGFLPEKIM